MTPFEDLRNRAEALGRQFPLYDGIEDGALHGRR